MHRLKSFMLVFACCCLICNIVFAAIRPHGSTKINLEVKIVCKGGKVLAYAKSTDVQNHTANIALAIQRKQNGKWTTVKTASGKSASAEVKAVLGSVYRATAAAKLYDAQGAVVDSASVTSAAVTAK